MTSDVRGLAPGLIFKQFSLACYSVVTFHKHPKAVTPNTETRQTRRSPNLAPGEHFRSEILQWPLVGIKQSSQKAQGRMTNMIIIHKPLPAPAAPAPQHQHASYPRHPH